MEINEYVRTKDGKIGKYIQPDLGKPNITNGISFNEGANYGKHSKDIIDLIEVGDYFNGYKVMLVNKNCLMLSNGEIVREIKINDKIVTKEQYASMEYKVN